jgi:hypothetical protein
MTPNPPLTPDDDEAGRVPFANCSGRNVRVAVIDSGVNPRHPHIAGVAGGRAIGDAGDMELDFTDRLGHGTAVMAAIQEKAPAAEYFAIKVFHAELRTSAANLIRAIECCIEQNMDVVNLSLGTTNPAHRERFERVAAKASEAGTLLVAAHDANGQPCYPGSLDGVIGVGLDWDCPRNSFRQGAGGETPLFFASGYPRPAPGVPRKRNLYGISFAVANLSAFVARACEAEGRQQRSQSVRLIREALIRECAAISAGKQSAFEV